MSPIPSITNQGLVASTDELAEGTRLEKVETGAAGAPTILVVDDDSALRTTARMILECHGFKTLAAGNGLEALQQMERNPQIAAVLLDLLMPVMNGEETFRQLRNFWAAIPVIFISGFAPSEVCQCLASPPPDGFVQKPFTFANLTNALSGVLA